MARYRKKPVEIDAIQVDGGSTERITRWAVEVGGNPNCLSHGFDGSVVVETLEGKMKADIGDWLICGVQHEIYPCKPDIFAATYERVPERPDIDQAEAAGY